MKIDYSQELERFQKKLGIEKITIPEGFSKEDVYGELKYIESNLWRKEAVAVIYHAKCGCEIEYMILLDRYPMTRKVWNTCPQCKSLHLMDISNPIKFYSKHLDKDYELKDLINMEIPDNPQKHFLELYNIEAKNIS